MCDSDERCIFGHLKQALRNLTAPAEEQIDYLDDLGVSPSIDELALEFDDVSVLAKTFESQKLLSKKALESLKLLDNKLASISKNKNLWSVDALQNSPDWAEVRNLARISLEMIEER